MIPNFTKWLFIGSLLCLSWSVTAQTILRVTSSSNTGPGTLRNQIAAANFNSNIFITSITIQFDVTTVNLTAPIIIQSPLGKTLVLEGLGNVTITGSGTRSINALDIRTKTTVTGLNFVNFNIALNIDQSSTCIVGRAGNSYSNTFLNNNFAIYSSKEVTIENNFIGTNRAKSLVNGNTNGVVVNTIGSEQNAYIRNNTICGSRDFAVLLATTGGLSVVSNNIIGRSGTGYGNGTAINITAGYLLIDNNTIENNTKAIVAGSGLTELQGNDFICNGGSSVFSHSNPYTQPDITNMVYQHDGQLTISGTSTAAEDVIEIYESNAAVCANTTLCQGLFKARTQAINKNWTATIKLTSGKQVFVNATDFNRINGPQPEGVLLGQKTSLFTTCSSPACPPLSSDLVKVSDVNCFGGSDGRARINVQQGTKGSFQYRILQTDVTPDVQTQAYKTLTTFDTIKILKKGQFQAIILNTMTGCSYKSAVITINQPNAPLSLSNCQEVSPTSSPSTSDGRGQITISGGTPPYTITYRKDGGAIVNFGTSRGGIVPINNLAASNYVVTVTDGNYNGNLKTACADFCNFTITPPLCRALKATVVSLTNPTCFDSVGSFRVKCVDIAANLPLTLTISNSTGVVSTRTISNGGFPADSTFTISNLKAGTYNITLSSRNGACTVTTNTTLTQPTKLEIICDTVIHIARVGDATGKAEVITSGGSTPYRLSLSGAMNRPNFATVPSEFITTSMDNLIKGNYVATAIDKNGCIDTCRFIITEPNCTGFDLTADPDSVKCFGEKNGRIALAVVNGDSNYTFRWSDPSIGNQAIANGLDAGTYRATVTDGRNCRDSVQVIISTPSVLRASTTVDSIRAAGGTGTISITALGGTPDYGVELILNNAPRTLTRRTGNTFVFANLSKGTYTYTVTDANGCDTTGTVTLNDLLCNINIDAKADSVFCKNGTNGRITTTVTNGVAPLIYTWSNAVSTTASATGLRANTYWVAVSDSRSCVDSAYVTVYEPDSLSSIAIKTDVTRIAGTDGTIRVSIRGGTPDYTVRLANGTSATRESVNAFIFNNLPAGIYTINITDAKGCTDRKTVEIKEPVCNLTVSPQADSVRCNGGSDGRISLNIGNAIAPLSIRWSGGIPNNVATAENLRVGSYTASITDGRGCTIPTNPIVVAQPTRLTSAFTTTKTTRADSQDGTIQVIVSGGTQPYRVQLGTTTATVVNATTFRFTGLAVGRYGYTVTDDKGCTTRDSVAIDGPICTITLTKQVDSVRCQGTATGRIVLTATNAANPLAFNWSPNTSNTTNIASNLSMGIYYTTVTDANGCMAYDTIQVYEPTALNSTFTATHITVVGQTGSIRVVASGGTQPYLSVKIGTTIATAENATTFNFTGLVAGTYTYIVTDAKGCTNEKTVVINPLNCNLTVTSQRVDSVTCNGTSTGRIVLTTTGGTAPLSIKWNSDTLGTTLTASNLRAGIYGATVTDASRCTTSISVQVFEPTALNSTFMATHITVSGGTGAIKVVVSGGTQPYLSVKIGTTNAVAENATTFNFTGLAAGTYTYIVTDSKSCTHTQTVVINPLNCNLTVTSQRVDSVTCNGTSTGRIVLTTTGGTAPLSIKWNSDTLGTTLTASNLRAGTYGATVTDASRCSTSISVQVFEPIALNSIFTATHITVSGGMGAIKVVVSGGTPPYLSVKIGTTNATAENATTFNFTGLAAGTYTYIVTDSKGCTNEKTVVINPLNCNFTVTSQRVDSVTCNGTSTGRIVLTTTGGTAPLSIKWSSDTLGTALTASNLRAGIYGATVTDASRCSTSVSVVVTEPAALNSTSTLTHITAVGQTGSIRVVVSGGTPPYASVRIGTTNAVAENATTFNFTGLAAGTYTYIVTDSKGCTNEKTVVINSPNCNLMLTSQRVDSVTCNGTATGRIVLTTTGGTAPLSINWSLTSIGNTLTANNLRTGSYAATATDANRCSTSISVQVFEPTVLNSTFTPTHIVTVGQTGALQVVVSGGTLPYLSVKIGTTNATVVNNTTFNFTGLVAGSHTYIVTDAKGCTDEKTVVINAPNCNLTLTSQRVDSVTCNGTSTGRIVLATTGGTAPLSIKWSSDTLGTTLTASNLRAGTYGATVTDASRCSTSISVQVFEPIALNSIFTATHITVSGGTGAIKIVVSGGTPPYVSVRIGTTNATAENATTFNFTGLAAGTYTYVVTDAKGCTSDKTVVINSLDCTLTAQISVGRAISCFGATDGSINLTTNSQTPQYKWSNGSTQQNLTNVAAGIYKVTVTDAQNCTQTAEITLTQPPQIRATIAGDTAICAGQSARLRFAVVNATNFSLVFSNGTNSTTITNTEALVMPTTQTIFSLVSVQSSACVGSVSGSATVQVTTVPPPTIISILRDSLCGGSDLTITTSPSALPNVQYVWQTPNGTTTTPTPSLTIRNASSSHSGLYALRLATNSCQSAATPSIRVTVLDVSSQGVFGGNDKIECGGTTTNLSAQTIASQHITGNWVALDGAQIAQANLSNTNVSGLKTGNNRFVWSLTSSICGKIGTPDTVTVFVEKTPVALEKQFFVEGTAGSILINIKGLIQDSANVKFSTNVANSNVSMTLDNRFILVKRGDLTTAQTVEIPYQICSQRCTNLCTSSKLFINIAKLFVPTDSLNVEKLFITNSSSKPSLEIDNIERFEENEVLIVDRWGARVFGPTKYINRDFPDHAWDGKKDGKPLPNGAYYYIVKYKDKDQRRKKGGVIYLVEER